MTEAPSKGLFLSRKILSQHWKLGKELSPSCILLQSDAFRLLLYLGRVKVNLQELLTTLAAAWGA
jgi:hypothetical protein